MIVAVLPHLVVCPPGKREPNVDRARGKHLRWHHAHDRVGLVAKVDGFAEHVRIAVENALPEFVADHRNHRAADAIFFLGEDAPDLRLEADDFKKVSGDECARDLFRRAAFQSAQVIGFPARDRDIFENRVVPFPIDVIRIRHRDLRLIRVRLGQDDNAVAVRIRERLEQDRIDDTEDRRVRPDAERQGKNCDEREARSFPELAERETQIVHGALRYLTATSADAGFIEMLPAPERSTTDFPPPFIFPFMESRSVRVPVNGRSLVTRPELASASMSRPASAGTIRSMLPAEVSKFTSPGTGDFNFALIDPPDVRPKILPLMFSKASRPPLVSTFASPAKLRTTIDPPEVRASNDPLPSVASIRPPLVSTFNGPSQPLSSMLPPLVVAPVGPLRCVNFSFPPLVSALIV